MMQFARPLALAGAVALVGAALALSPLGATSALAQSQPTTQAPAAAPAKKMEKKPMMKGEKKMPAKKMEMKKGAMMKGEMKKGEMKPMAEKAGVSRRGVEIVQAALNNAGYKVEIDGRMGPKTHEVLKKYQADHKLKATGAIDGATLKSLNVKSLSKWG